MTELRNIGKLKLSSYTSEQMRFTIPKGKPHGPFDEGILDQSRARDQRPRAFQRLRGGKYADVPRRQQIRRQDRALRSCRRDRAGSPRPYAAAAEFDSVQAAIDFWDDPDYAAARALMGPLDDESAVVDRRVCCIEGEPLTATPKQGFWLNHVHEIIDEAAFFDYAEASMPHFRCVSFGTVVHQHAGEQKIQLAAALGFDSISKAKGIYHTPEYRAALAAGGMEGGEAHVVNRTICAIEVPE